MSTLPEQVATVVREKRLFRRGEVILVAVSGGVDSMVLLRLLHGLSEEFGWRLAVAHFNHQLRGAASDGDERFVAAAAQELGLACHTGRADVRKHAREQAWSLEMAARQLRHEFLAQTARRLGLVSVALAHHLDDQLELFFLRLFRGAGGEGLGGMKWLSPSPAKAEVLLVRPLLGCPKAELVAYAKAENIADRPDASNAWVDIQRNRIRQELLPLLLRQYQPALRKTLPRVMDILGAEADYCGEQARAWLARKRRPAFARLPLALQRRALQRQLRALGVEPDFDLVAELCQWPDRPVTVSPETQVVRDQSGKVCQRETAPPQFCPQEMKLELSAPAGSANFGPVQIAWEFLPASGVARGSRRPRSGRGQPDGATAHVAASEEYFDAGKVGRHVVLRHWRPGDRFQPIGMKSGVRLQDLFVNQKVPRARRHELVVATTGQGGVFWVEGLRMAEPFKLDKQTALRLKWAWRRR